MLELALEGRVGALAIEAAFATNGGPLVVTGPNGSGKTTLLLMALGVRKPARGKLTVGGRVLFDSEQAIDVPVEARALGYLPQSFGLFPHLNARENVEFALACRHLGKSSRERRELARTQLAELGIEALAELRPGALSAGERQRVALARAIAAKPRALLLDEPFAALDVGTRRQVRTFLRDYLERLALPTIVVSHDANDARAIGGRIAVIEAGRVSQTGSWRELCENPASAFVRELTL
ncbi:MAG TPA: ATP-binding cassette domain-containing protein [Polyangiaceae bacterium]|jgi:molybdate transport system ATP-binding protein|nr:ATP-binding cassette domain-containing protein [Polyangiaceae bacterium]